MRTKLQMRTVAHRLLFWVGLLFVVTNAFGQENIISGTVSDNLGQPIPGGTVVIKGSATGTATDSDGKYTIRASSTNVLVFSFIGYTTQEITVGDQSSINVSMQEDVAQLQEVVVTALGIKSDKRALGYATAQVEGEQIGAVKATNNFVNSLSGKVPGVNISSTSSQPGSGTRIVIRGGSSITGNNEPLIVVNGVPFDASNTSGSSGLGDIDPNSIESLSVLKGAAAAALYGSQAANGVILITLKTGAINSKPVITLSNTSSFDKIYEVPLQKNWSQGRWDSGTNDWQYIDGETQFTSTSFGPRISDVPGAKYYDRWDVFKTGFTNETNLSVSGGTPNASYYISYSGLKNNGTLEPLEYKRNSLNANTSFKFTPKLTIGSNIMYSKQNIDRLAENSSNSAFMNTFLAGPNTWNAYPLRDANGNLRSYRGGSRDPYLWTLENTGENNIRDRFNATVTVEYQILPKLKFRSATGVSTTSTRNENHMNRDGIASVNGEYNSTEQFSRDIESTETVTYDNEFGDFSVTALVGNYIKSNYWRGSDFNGTGLVIPGIYNSTNVSGYQADSYRGDYRSYSFFGQAMIGYKNFLYYSITGRNDWASSVPDSFFYPSQSLSFVFSELLQKSDIFSYGKLRASYAKVGSPADAYARNVVLEQAGDGGGFVNGVTWPFNGQRSYLSSSKIPNLGLTNEFKSEVELGLELKLFKSRLGVDVSVYHNWSENQILSEQFLSSTGYTYGTVNIGGITHKGIEVGLTGSAVKRNNFSWDITLNWSKDNSMVDKLGTNNEPIDLGSYGTAIVGQPYPVIYGPGFLRDDQGRLVLDDAPGTGFGRPLQDNSKNQIFGKTSPDWLGSLRNTFVYKNFVLMAQVDMSQGGNVFNLNDHYLTYYGMAQHQDDRPDNNMTTFDGVMGHFDYTTNKAVVTSETPQPTRYDLYFQNVAQGVLEENVMPKDYIKLRELQLSYKVPMSVISKTFLQGFQVGLSGRNLWRKFNKSYEGIDPENNTDGINNGNGYQGYSLPATRTYSITLTAKF
ncbi:MAG: SusC/RagA family TonB-linked outer membrane protein [Flammeovirgaceae bacterium]|nr:SusC/RagA family TonB-linked outer membrane protein [Flammeovirgaceae bacterium]